MEPPVRQQHRRLDAVFAISAGAAGYLVDRRRLLLGTTLFMAATTAALGVLTIAGLVTPWALAD